MGEALVAVTGPLRGQRVDLEGGEVSLGRHPSNTVSIPDIGVSRRHCLVCPRADGFEVRDLESRHGTFVNERPVAVEPLRVGDVLVIGASTFLVVGDEPPPSPSPVVDVSPTLFEVDGDCSVPETAIHLPLAAARFLQGTSVSASADDARTLAALLALGRAAGDATSVEALAPTIVRHLLTLVPASRAAVLTLVDGGVSVEVVSSSDGEGKPRRRPVSQSVVRRALADGRALLANDLAEGDLATAPSVVAAGAHAALCVPLVRGEQALGALYLDRFADDARPEVQAGFDTTHGELAVAAAALAAPAFETLATLEHLRVENERLRSADDGHGLVGASEALAKVRSFIARAAPTDSTVLILGESGTGKELVARALHAGSDRQRRPFVAINCATLSDTLLESELFGHEKGAFTGAVARKTGKLELADGGTLFLDEVGVLPGLLQAKLLRVLEERTFERVGGTRPVRADVRLITATNRDLKQAIADGTMRADLYYRLDVVSVTLPPLRDRAGDLPLLARHFVRHHAARVKRRVVGLAPATFDALEGYRWPGNVRELSNAIERAVVLGLSQLVQPEDLPETVLESSPSTAVDDDAEVGYHEALNRAKCRVILEAYAAAGGNVTRAAERLGLHPNHLHRLISSLGLRERLKR